MKKKLSIAALAMVMGMGATTAWSLTNEKEVEKRIQRLEKKIRNVDKRSQKRFTKMNSQMSTYLERMRVNGFFSTSVATSDSDAQLTVVNNLTNSENYTASMVAGLQFDFQANEKTNIVIQMTATGEGHKAINDESANLLAEWAYVSYQFTDNLQARVGRLRLPFYRASEYLEVGYAYPWISPPMSVYGLLPLDSYNGVDIIYEFDLFGISTVYHGYRGVIDINIDIGAFKLKNIYGHALTFSKGPVEFRTSFTQANAKGVLDSTKLIIPDDVASSTDYANFLNTELPQIIAAQLAAAGVADVPNATILALSGLSQNDQYLAFLATQTGKNVAGISNPLAAAAVGEGILTDVLTQVAEPSKPSFLSYALAYQDHGWQIILEGDRFHTAGDLQDTTAHYFSVAKQLGSWTPYLAFGEVYTNTDSKFNTEVGDLFPVLFTGLGFNNINQRDTTVGVRWDFVPGVALKFETQRLSHFKETKGLFDQAPGDNNVNIYSMAIDAVF